MPNAAYLMESHDEVVRLELKTDSGSVRKQAGWAGLKAGMRVADIGCGSGKTTILLHELAQPGGKAVGVDISPERIAYAGNFYGGFGVEFIRRDVRDDLADLGFFDFIFIRFVLEYHRERSVDIVRNVSRILKPGGIFCLIDLDYNCLNHFQLSPRLQRAICGVMDALEKGSDFDPYAGRKLYSYLYDLGYQEIDATIAQDHVVFGKLQEKDAFNWMKKVEAARKSGYTFDEFPGGYEEFATEFRDFFTDPRRFTYTPVICCRGRKPL